MITLLEYLVIAAVIGAVVFVLAVLVFGRGEQMAPLSPRTSPAQLPGEGIGADDVRSVKFSLALRGYRMSDVDWVLDRVGDRIDELERDNARLRGQPLPDRSLADDIDASAGPPAADLYDAGSADTLAMSPDREQSPAAAGSFGPAGPGPAREDRR
ncbi:DivIVA domain-containing protein [Nakamurella endophytica]|uniref:DivIVA domain-containing protein n=1 Tax=Nakamurella endophytica TaxID=1748367 RepID=A0A917WE10_9ACTN|nr:DivIVA domain-containing protein [Nakamurella endophytica]GGL95865.1 hypothetical protein GCM10011594_14470 [Nakamurella endophytica]